MADSAGPALNMPIETGKFDEKEPISSKQQQQVEDDDEDEDIDALIEDLESIDGHEQDDEEESGEGGGMNAGAVSPEFLNTNTSTGLTAQEVLVRRKRFGLNQMREEKENLLKKFCMFFVGPIQFVMEAAALLAAGLEDWVDFGVICALLLLNACVGFIQE
jgi:H+-transporting ATPase